MRRGKGGKQEVESGKRKAESGIRKRKAESGTWKAEVEGGGVHTALELLQ
jgi:hypothetical protein